MALPILDELKQELDRVYAAGSGLAKGDPRLLKYLPALAAMGRKAPVFNSMAEKLKALCEEENTADNLLDLGNILYSVLYTQCSSPDTTGWREPAYVENSLPETKLNAAILEKLASDLEKKAANYMNISVLESLRAKGLHTDPRLYRSYCKAVSGDSSNMEEYLEEKLLPSLGPAFDSFLEDELPRALGKRLKKIKDIIERRKSRRGWI
jgi:hypothetical protein